MATSGLNSIDDIPRQWRAALASIQVLAPNAVMAGGCLRDREHGVKVKDIDIFVPCETVDRDEGRRFEQRMKADGWPDVKIIHDKTYNGERISASIETKFPNCPPINVIVMPYSLDEFDFGICQIAFDGKRIIRTAAYNTDRAARVFRLIPVVDDASFIRTIERWGRLKEKYPGWKLHLGSRASVQNATLTARTRQFNHPGVTSLAQAQAQSRLHRPGKQVPVTMNYISPSVQPMVVAFQNHEREVVVTRAIAERFAKELAKTQITPARNGPIDHFKVDVHPDETAAAIKIVQDIADRQPFVRR